MAVVAALCIAAGANAGTADIQILTNADIWTETCNAVQKQYPKKVDCSKITPPIIVESQAVEDLFINGGRVNGIYYWGEPYIFVRPGQIRTMIHEMVHFIAVPLGIATETCDAEALARSIAGQPWGQKEQERYRCVKPKAEAE